MTKRRHLLFFHFYSFKLKNKKISIQPFILKQQGQFEAIFAQSPDTEGTLLFSLSLYLCRKCSATALEVQQHPKSLSPSSWSSWLTWCPLNLLTYLRYSRFYGKWVFNDRPLILTVIRDMQTVFMHQMLVPLLCLFPCRIFWNDAENVFVQVWILLLYWFYCS